MFTPCLKWLDVWNEPHLLQKGTELNSFWVCHSFERCLNMFVVLLFCFEYKALPVSFSHFYKLFYNGVDFPLNSAEKKKNHSLVDELLKIFILGLRCVCCCCRHRVFIRCHDQVLETLHDRKGWVQRGGGGESTIFTWTGDRTTRHPRRRRPVWRQGVQHRGDRSPANSNLKLAAASDHFSNNASGINSINHLRTDTGLHRSWRCW